MKQDKYFQQVLVGSGYGFIGKLIGSLIEFGFIIYITRHFSIIHIGYYFMGLAVFRFIHAFSVSGLDYAARRYISIDNNRKNIIHIFIKKWSLKLIPIYGGLAIYILFSYFNTDDILKPLIISGFIITVPFASSVAIGTSIFQGLKRILTATFLRDILVPLFRLIIVFILIKFNFGIIGVITGYFMSFVILSIVTCIILKPHIISSNYVNYQEINYQEVNNYSSNMMYITIINLILIWGTTLILGIFNASEEVALYSVSLRISTFSILLIAMPIYVIFEPIISELYAQGKQSLLIRTYRQTTNILLIAMILITMITVVFSEYILILFGTDYLSSQILLFVIIFGQLFGITAGPAENIMVMIGRQKTSFYINLIISIAILLLDLFFIPIYGVLAAAIFTAIGFAAKGLFSLLYISIQDKITPFNSTYWLIMITGAVGLIIILEFRNSFLGFIVLAFFCCGYTALMGALIFKITKYRI